MMSGLIRTLLAFLAVVVVVAAVVVPVDSAYAQSAGCTMYDDRVSCVVTFDESPVSGSTSALYLSSTGSWVEFGTSATTPPYAVSTWLGAASSQGSLYYAQITLFGLTADTTYTVLGRRGSTRYGYKYSAPVTFHTAANLADAPEQLSVARNDAGDEATVTWAAPDGTVTSYLIQRAELQRSSGVAVWGDETYFTTADASSTTHTDTELDPDKTYQYQVAGVNDNGTGFYSVTVRTIGAAGEVAVTVDDRTFDAIPTPDHGQLPTGYDAATGDAEMVAAVDSSITQVLGPTGLTWDAAKMRHFLVVFGAGGLAGLGLIGNNRLGGKLSGQSVLLAFLLFNLGLWLGVRWLGFPWYWAMLPTLLTVGWGLMTFGRKVTA